MLVSIDRQRNALWLNVTALSVNVALNLALIPRFGFMAAAWTTAGCELVNFAGMLVLLRRYAGYRWHVEGWRSIVVLTGVCALGTAGLREVGFPAIAVTGIVAAVWSAVALRVGIVPMSLLPNRSGAEAVG
jgi:O-antigen/teichoic acid export membrane protein